MADEQAPRVSERFVHEHEFGKPCPAGCPKRVDPDPDDRRAPTIAGPAVPLGANEWVHKHAENPWECPPGCPRKVAWVQAATDRAEDGYRLQGRAVHWPAKNLVGPSIELAKALSRDAADAARYADLIVALAGLRSALTRSDRRERTYRWQEIEGFLAGYLGTAWTADEVAELLRRLRA